MLPLRSTSPDGNPIRNWSTILVAEFAPLQSPDDRSIDPQTGHRRDGLTKEFPRDRRPTKSIVDLKRAKVSMRLAVLPLGVLLCAGSAFATEPQAAPTWNEVQAAAAACAMKVTPVSLPDGLKATVRGPAYQIDPSASPDHRQCFYRTLNMPEAERLLREFPYRDR
jgi:hypothetical protein